MSSLADLDVAGKRVFLRCDLNVPLKEGKITDDGRIRASLPTINALLAKGASIVIAAHLGRPKGEAKPELSLAPVAVRLAELLGKPVQFAGAITGSDVTAKAHSLGSGEILLLENIRFSAAETSKDESERASLAAELAKLADFYVGDGFGAVHRKHASVFDLAKLLPHAPGTLVAAEVEVLKKLTIDPVRPYGVVLGGSKVSDKIGVISNLLGKVDVMAIGGGMLFTFLAAQGKEIGSSLVERDLIDTVKTLIKQAEDSGVKLLQIKWDLISDRRLQLHSRQQSRHVRLFSGMVQWASSNFLTSPTVQKLSRKPLPKFLESQLSVVAIQQRLYVHSVSQIPTLDISRPVGELLLNISRARSFLASQRSIFKFTFT